MPIYVDIFQKCCVPWLRQELLGHDLGRLGKYELVPKIKKTPFFGYTKKIQKKYKNYTLFLELATPVAVNFFFPPFLRREKPRWGESFRKIGAKTSLRRHRRQEKKRKEKKTDPKKKRVVGKIIPSLFVMSHLKRKWRRSYYSFCLRKKMGETFSFDRYSKGFVFCFFYHIKHRIKN